jgi:hypothetical protein
MTDDLMDNGLYGGNADDYDYNAEDAEDVEDNEDNFFAGGNPEDTLYKLGGAKQENENTFCVESANVGSYQGGRFVSTSAYNAAKKAATAIFKNVDKEMGVVKQPKTKGKGKVATKNHVKKISFVLYRHDKKKPVKFYKYEAERVQADQPVVIDRTVNKGTSKEKVVRITFSQQVSIKPVELDQEYIERNKEEQKIFAAKKRAAKRKAEAAENPEKKQRKPKTAAKKAKKVASLQDVIAALTSPAKKTKATKTKVPKAPKDKAPKAPKDKAPKAAKAPKAKAAKKGGGFCSFF